MARLEIEIDDGDWPFVRAVRCDDLFSTDPQVVAAATEEAQRQMRELGFVVFCNVVPLKQCVELRCDMWKLLEEKVQGFKRHQPSTWGKWKAGNYGMSGKTAVFRAPFLKIRQSERLAACFAAVLQVSERDLIASHDR